MKVTFLGTGTSHGVPLIGCKCKICVSLNPKDKRLRSSVIVDVNKKRLVIDTGPDFRQQMLKEKVDCIDAVIYTHDHRDHVAGLDDIRAFNYIMNKSIDIYAADIVQKGIREQFGYIFKEKKYPGIPDITFHTIENQPFHINELEVTPILVKHMSLPVFGFRIQNFSYITDANFIAEKEKKKIYGSEVLVLNGLRKEPHPSHFTLSEAVKLAQELNCKNTYITHISHQLGLHEEVNDELPANIQLAHDGLSLFI